METNKMSNLNRIFTRNMLRHFMDGKTDNVYATVVKRYICDNVKIKFTKMDRLFFTNLDRII